MSCVFCNIEPELIIYKNDLAFVIKDKYPQSKGHLLIIPFRHFENYFQANADEISAMNDLLFKAKNHINDLYCPSGFNVNINVGKTAGQIVPHSHIHLIPRY
ncbi:MAG: AP-4-A phosphorylase [Ignavibacteria bacterium]|nr:AP-4-A phosphorylase [Ignavibacteria bacterium]